MLVYRTSNGKKYPGFIFRLIIATILILISFRLVNGTLTKDDFKFAFWFRLLSCVAVQEWIFQLCLWNAKKFYNPSGKWKFFVIQAGLGIVLPTSLLLLNKSLFYDLSQITSIANPVLQMDKVLFYPHIIVLLNLLYCTCLIAPTEYVGQLVFTDGFGTKILNTADIDLVIDNDEDVILSVGDEWFATKTTERIKRELNNLNPLDFKTVFQGTYINKKLLSGPEDNGADVLVKRLARLTLKVSTDATARRHEEWMKNKKK